MRLLVPLQMHGNGVVASGCTHLKEDLQHSMEEAQAAPKEHKERHQQLQDVVAECLEAVEPPG